MKEIKATREINGKRVHNLQSPKSNDRRKKIHYNSLDYQVMRLVKHTGIQFIHEMGSHATNKTNSQQMHSCKGIKLDTLIIFIWNKTNLQLMYA